MKIDIGESPRHKLVDLTRDEFFELDNVGGEFANTLGRFFGRHGVVVHEIAEFLFIDFQTLGFRMLRLFRIELALHRFVGFGKLFH
jgi:hypothetical protein